jgi:hypothetical protein
LPFADLGRTYENGQVTEARSLARKYLASSEAAVRSAKSDAERFDAVKLVQRATSLMFMTELTFPRAGRFRDSADLLDAADRALTTAESASIPKERLAGVQWQIGATCRSWLGAANGVEPRAELDRFFRAHASRLADAGLSPDLYSSLIDQPEGRNPKPGDVQRVASLAETFVRAYAARDAGTISESTHLSAASVASRLAAGNLNFFAGTADRVSKIALRPISAEWIAAHLVDEGDFLVYLPAVKLQLVAPDGTAYAKTVDRTLYMSPDYQDPLRLRIYVRDDRLAQRSTP